MTLEATSLLFCIVLSIGELVAGQGGGGLSALLAELCFQHAAVSRAAKMAPTDSQHFRFCYLCSKHGRQFYIRSAPSTTIGS